MNNFMDALEFEDSKTITGNGEVGHSTTLNKILDFHSLTGNSRFISSSQIKNKFDSAYTSDKVLATKALFNARDVLKGGGDKKLGRLSVRSLVDKLPKEKLPLLFDLVTQFGSYKDLVLLLGQRSLTESQVSVLSSYLMQALKESELELEPGNSNSGKILVAKYLPTETTKSSFMKLAYLRLIKHSKMTRKEYRKRISYLRKELKLVETDLTNRDYESIEYSKVPSQAMRKYKEAFFRNDYENISKFLDKVNNGEVKVNTSTLEPYQLVERYTGLFETYRLDNDSDKYLTTLWNNLPKQETSLNSLPIIDVSGSMTGLPMDVAISLGMYLSEQNTNEDYHNKFITFSESPKLVTIPENSSLNDKVATVASSDWGYNTNLEAVFNLVLSTAVKNNHTQEDLPDSLVILSDMHMDMSDGAFSSNTFFENMEAKYKAKGYDLPFILFWNIDGDAYGMDGDSHPVTHNTKNTCYVSGFSKNIYETIMELDVEELSELTPTRLLLDILNHPRYEEVEKLFN